LQVFGSGFSERALDLLRARPEVVAAGVNNEHLRVDLREKAQAAPLVSLLVSAGVQVEEVRRGKASLEEVFLTLMEEERS
jgi:ABC-2 type transport system ATP-binding protein